MRRRNFLLAAPAFIAAPMLMKVRAPVWTEPLFVDLETQGSYTGRWSWEGPARVIVVRRNSEETTLEYAF